MEASITVKCIISHPLLKLRKKWNTVSSIIFNIVKGTTTKKNSPRKCSVDVHRSYFTLEKYLNTPNSPE